MNQPVTPTPIYQLDNPKNHAFATHMGVWPGKHFHTFFEWFVPSEGKATILRRWKVAADAQPRFMPVGARLAKLIPRFAIADANRLSRDDPNTMDYVAIARPSVANVANMEPTIEITNPASSYPSLRPTGMAKVIYAEFSGFLEPAGSDHVAFVLAFVDHRDGTATVLGYLTKEALAVATVPGDRGEMWSDNQVSLVPGRKVKVFRYRDERREMQTVKVRNPAALESYPTEFYLWTMEQAQESATEADKPAPVEPAKTEPAYGIIELVPYDFLLKGVRHAVVDRDRFIVAQQEVYKRGCYFSLYDRLRTLCFDPGGPGVTLVDHMHQVDLRREGRDQFVMVETKRDLMPKGQLLGMLVAREPEPAKRTTSRTAPMKPAPTKKKR